MNNKILAIGLLAVGMMSQIALADFNDVTSDNANFDAISYGQQKGIIAGYADGTFKPENKINRAEFIKIVIGANFTQIDIDACLAANKGQLFSDTSNTEWYAKFLCLAKQNSVISGYPDGSFKPGQNINFAEAAKIITVAKGGHSMGSSLNDQQADWYKRYVTYLETAKAIPATIKNISYEITRGEMMEIIYRLDKGLTDKFSLTYDQAAGTEMACIKAGGTAGGIVYPNAPHTDCCTGLIPYAKSFDKGGQLLGGYAALCLEPVTGLDQAVKIMGTANECTNSKDLGQSLSPAPYKNGNFNGFSFPMTSYTANCVARCDVNLDTSTASIGWMCTGAVIN